MTRVFPGGPGASRPEAARAASPGPRAPPACQRLCFVGSDIYTECAMAAHKLGTHIGGQGKVAVIGVIDPENVEAEVKNRMFISQLTRHFPKVDVVSVAGGGKYDIKNRSHEIARRVLREHPDLVGIYSNADEAVSGIVEAVTEAARKGWICLVAYGNEPHVMGFVREGLVTYALVHNRFVYGYDALVCLYNKLVAGIEPPGRRILHNPDVVCRQTLDEFWDPREGFRLTDKTKRYLLEPVKQRPARPLRFMVLLEGIGQWFPPVMAGASEAEKMLPDTTVRINNWKIEPEAIAEQRVATLEQAVREGYDGVVLWVLNEELIPHINQAVDQGVEVVVFHTEPVDYSYLTPEVDQVFDSLFRQMTLLEDAENRLRRLSNEDELTGLHNRRRFDAYLEREWKSLSRTGQSSLSLLMLDIDRFKQVNDRYGHLVGDTCLRRVAKLIREGINRPRDFAARYGGEEFAVVLPETDQAGARVIADRIRRAIERHRMDDCEAFGDVTVSIGVACADGASRREDETHSGLVERADQALYAAKAAGRNRVEVAG
jgi:diguanylate cyclase (GGDEF)-like protein